MSSLYKFCSPPICLGLLLLTGACSPSESNDTNFLASANETTRLGTKEADYITEGIDALVSDSLLPDGPGVAVLVLENNQVLHADGYGFSDIDAQTLITPETVFDLASVSKQMTAIAILRLMEQGKLDLAAPVSDYLPEFEDLELDNPVLVKDLLHHTSGLSDYTGDGWDGSETAFANLDLESHLTWLNAQEPLDEPGMAFEYNNSGYGLLALIVQRVSGQSFPEFMSTEIFQPAGMAQTLVYSQLGQTITNQATGYFVDDNEEIEPSSFPSVMAGDGNVFSSLTDLARYDMALRENKIVSASTLAMAFSNGALADGEPIYDDGEGYSMGWQIAADYVHHGGSWLGTSTYYRHYTNVNRSIIILSNDEAYDTMSLAEEIAELL